MPTATATPRAVKNMIAVSKDSKVQKLGYVCWFSVPDEDLKLSRLRSKWLTSGLDRRPLPGDQKQVNAFKRAVRAQEGISINEKDGTKTETDVREFPETAERVEYQVTRVTRDLSERRIQYEAAIRVGFIKKDVDGNPVETIDFDPLGDVAFKDAKAIMDGIRAAYDDASETVPGAKVRTMVRNVLKDPDDDKTFGFSGENLRGKAGGVYFVLAKHEYNLERLADLLWTLWPNHTAAGAHVGPGRAYLHMIPMADGRTERELIRRHYRMNSLGDIDEAMFDLAKLLREDEESKAKGATRARGIRDNVLKHHEARIERLADRLAEYGDVLGGELSDVDKRLKALQAQMAKVRRLG